MIAFPSRRRSSSPADCGAARAEDRWRRGGPGLAAGGVRRGRRVSPGTSRGDNLRALAGW